MTGMAPEKVFRQMDILVRADVPLRFRLGMAGELLLDQGLSDMTRAKVTSLAIGLICTKMGEPT